MAFTPTPPPTPPSLSDPESFGTRSEAWLVWQQTFATEISDYFQATPPNTFAEYELTAKKEVDEAILTITLGHDIDLLSGAPEGYFRKFVIGSDFDMEVSADDTMMVELTDFGGSTLQRLQLPAKFHDGTIVEESHLVQGDTYTFYAFSDRIEIFPEDKAGSNADSSWMAYGNGELAMSGKTTLTFNNGGLVDETVTFGKEFTDDPHISFTVLSKSGGPSIKYHSGSSFTGLSATDVTFEQRHVDPTDTFEAGDTVTVLWVARGKWYG